jgi:microcin C transport system substrate-binding protein
MRKIIYNGILFLTVLLFASCDGQGGQSSALSAENMIVIGGAQMPKSLNFFIDYGSFSIQVAGLIYESLCTRDLDTWELKGALAESWTVSPDKLTFTFNLNKNARWADDTPVTSADVMFTYETIMNPDNLTALFRMDYENSFEDVYAPDKYTVIFKAKNERWSNFISAYSFVVLPKHEFEGKNFNKDFNLMLPPGSGPYEIEDVEAERFITLKRRADYWGDAMEGGNPRYSFERIKYKFILEDAIRFEALKKGELDFLYASSAKDWIAWTQENVPHQIKQNWIAAKRIFNHMPEGYQGFHMNLHRKIFKDIRVRKALAHLLNVDLINEKIMYNQYIPTRSYFPDFFNNDGDLPRFDYDPERARALLAQAGWDRVDNDGVLMNAAGERFEIEFLYTHESLEKHITIFKEDCAKVGIHINLNLISAAAYRKRVFEDRDFDITWIAWGRGGRFPSVEDGWKSDRADEPNTNNVTGYRNPELDMLIEEYLEEYDLDKREALLKKIDLILTNDVPTILLWGAPYSRIFYWNKFAVLPRVVEKYADAIDGDSVYTYWRIDETKLQNLRNAVQNNTALPDEPINVFYDDELKKKYAEVSD